MKLSRVLVSVGVAVLTVVNSGMISFAAESNVIQYVNEVRTSYGLNTLTENEDLNIAADIRAEEASEYMSHIRPTGEDFYTVNEKLVYGENLARGYEDTKAVDAWMMSQAHKDNLLGDYTQIGVGTFTSTNGTYLAALFG